ncbi:type I secretion system permease/ATPase [Aliterella atlantica]|uniref:Peptidase C39 n=1 Tax=Aliterella atlantica CENA595 TaxID=1618023 RepID=A0A0D8ZSG0_9CYAN|nr:type I secretion system permease/ATPase [Aliterella atlantica]KJH71675.1 peptidase C39 [Aliterella atlantica CENA595]
MDINIDAIAQFLSSTPPFDALPSQTREQLAAKCQLLRYRMGQAIVRREAMPVYIAILYQGQARVVCYPANAPETLELVEPGYIFGWVSAIRQVPCETALASTEAICLTLPVTTFLEFLEREPQFAAAFYEHSSAIEVFNLLEGDRSAAKNTNLKELALTACKEATVLNLPPGKTSLHSLEPNKVWLLSGGTTNFAVGSRLVPTLEREYIKVSPPGNARLVGLHLPEEYEQREKSSLPNTLLSEIPYAPEYPESQEKGATKIKYPYIHARGPVEATLACLQMVAQHLSIPFRRDVLRRSLTNSFTRTGSISLQLCGAVGELIGLKSQIVNIPASTISRLPTPAMIPWQDSFAILYKASQEQIVLAIPETGIREMKIAAFVDAWGESGQVLLLQATSHTPTRRFGISWFLPSLYRYRKVLLEVFIASFFVQLFGLANPLVTQVIIDRVLAQNSIETLNVLGIFLIVIATFEAVITSLRTNLFVDTTNRIDLSLGAQVIDRLLRLPLRYFERRPVGELATRVGELENIRQFLTGTALTVVLDAVFSVIYIVVMIFYSPLLTIVALATVPLFALLTLVAAPIVRNQARTKAERNAETQSYLVEVVSGIQTVKAQNIELRSRWQWQERYARYVSAGFNSTLTSTTASSISNFLNKLSSLLLLWVGAYLVLQGNLTLGQLIAFRIIAGYTTSPLLRLIQLWQNFQETALSLERLGDILDTPTEIEVAGKDNIPMPEISGRVQYESVSFRFSSSGEKQLKNVNLDFPSGTFVGVVGLSGAGKSTLTKLLPRLYELDSGRILIDGYDISKVELYSLRSQIGVVLQDTLLFDGTVQENIALTNPDATQEEIVAAAKVAVAHDFIMSLPQGYNTRVGERGAALSGGQRQRIAIARTVLQNPKILVLDEATSALDYHSERQVCLNLADVFSERTVMFITHRLATIKHADVIVMMDAGRVSEQGTHAELMQVKGHYYCLYQQQEAVTVTSNQ